MDDRDDGDVGVDKQWASKYILGPLYDPEPSQVCATRLNAFSAAPSPRQSHQDGEQPLLRRLLSRSNSLKRKPLPAPPPGPRYPPISGHERKRSIHTANPPQTRWNQGTILSRASSAATSRPSAGAMVAVPDENRSHRRAGSLTKPYPGDGPDRPRETLTQERRAKDGEDALPRRAGSLRERYPGDMSHRPLDILKREHRAADRVPHLHRHRRQQPSDTIDSLDLTGPVPGVPYHHGGPFDPTMKAWNRNKKYSPVEAVSDTNMEALKATPIEFVQDSLVKHVPLQGTAVVPPGMPAIGGRTMEYEEGADLMREDDAPGGPYKRWEHVRYRDDDLKGKGEPSFSIDQTRRAQKASAKQFASRRGETAYYEMQASAASPTGSGSGAHKGERARARQRSVSNAADQQAGAEHGMAGSSGLQSSSTTGKSIAQTLKRRFGSLRKKRASEEAGY